MAKALPLLARQLKARRQALGATQEEMAARLGVDKTTLWRWESGKTLPKSKTALQRLRRAYGASQDELNEWFAGATVGGSISEAGYVARGYDFLVEKGIDLHDLLDRLIEIDTQLLPNVRTPEEGTAEQWLPLLQESTSTWRILTYGEEIVGYSLYLCLTAEAFALAMDGRLRDGEIEPSMVEFPLPLDSGQTYRMYIVMFGVDPPHQGPAADMILLRDFVREMQAAAEAGVFFSKVCTVAFSCKSAYLCRQIGMRTISRYRHCRNGDVGEVFYLEGSEIADTGLAANNHRLANLYRKRFAVESRE